MFSDWSQYHVGIEAQSGAVIKNFKIVVEKDLVIKLRVKLLII